MRIHLEMFELCFIEEEFGDLEEVDIQNQEFWQRFENILHHTFDYTTKRTS